MAVTNGRDYEPTFSLELTTLLFRNYSDAY